MSVPVPNLSAVVLAPELVKLLDIEELRMRVKQSLILVMGFVFMFAGSVYAQESQTPAPVAPQSPAMDIQGLKSYLLGPGDIVDIRVFGQPDLNSTAQVDSDGNLSSLPFLEVPVKAKCRTEKDVQKDIIAAYSNP